jgi:aspartate racemase
MNRLGIIGGLGPESTIEYYRALLVLGSTSVLINSVDLERVIALVTGDARPELTDYLVDEIEVLARAGACLGLIAANTPHVVFDEVRARSPIPLVSIVEAACAAVQDAGFKRVGLLGTRFTMQGRFYPDVFSREGLTLVMPNEAEQTRIHRAYMDELLKGIFLLATRDYLLDVIGRLAATDGAEAVILAGTELPLILPERTVAAVPLLDTTKMHVAAAVRQLRRMRDL